MKYVLTLIGNNAAPLQPAHLGAAASLLPAKFASEWLAPDMACDLTADIDPSKAKFLEKALRDRLEGEKIDIVLQPALHRRKKLLVADMDSTIIQQECIDELADELGIKPQISEITETAMRGEIEFEPALRARVALLKGLPETSLQKVYDERIRQTAGAQAMIQTMRAHGATAALVSGGFTFFTQRVADAVGFQTNQANILIIEDGKLTGEVSEPILGRQAKVEALLKLREEHRLLRAETMAVGDGANDLDMIAEAGLGIAYHAKPVVAEAAAARIDHGDLTALLYLQGYRIGEFARA